jgi:glycosyl transferase family 25
VLEDDLILADGITTCFNDGWFPPGIDIARLETYYRRVHVGRKKIVVGPNRHLSRLCSTFYGSGCYAISQNAASRLLDLTENFVDAVDVVLFDLAHPIASKLLVYQMNPAPAIQGHLARHHEVSGTWVQSSIGLRGAQPNSKVLSQTFTFQRVARRFNEEVRALVGGTRYVLVAHG